MYHCRKHVLICTASHCMQKGAQQVAGRLRIEMKRKGLDTDVLVNTCDSIDLCDIGPNIVVYPDGIIYHGVKTGDLPELLDSLREGGTPVERLRLIPGQGDEERRREFFALAVEREWTAAEEFQRLAAEHGFDDAWVAEQARRGFIARREIEGQTAIVVTTKARNRYGLPDSAD